MREALRAADKMTAYAGLKYLTFAGADPEERMHSARRWLLDQITLRPDADPNLIARLKGEHAEPHEPPDLLVGLAKGRVLPLTEAKS
jgi:hypothetical protein